ncbi:RNA 2',3'-cyclic phosphodiesterase, partial [Serratia marcescens]
MSNSRRLFFALSLPDALQQQVIRWRAEAFAPEAGRPVVAANLHLTLAFLGEVTAQKELALRKLAGRIVQPGFSMRLDDLGHWPRPGVVWLGT